jgi:FkbM family methyltransferase
MIIAGLLKDRRYRPRGIVHVGAHLAQEMDDYLALEPELIVWIEGDPDTAAKLRERVDERQVVIAALIADEDGRSLPFHRFSNEGMSSSVFRATHELTDHWPEVRETGEVLELETSRLDTVLTPLGPPDAFDVLVFDIQGAELLAMRGAGAYLDAARFVESEVSIAEIYDGGPLVGEVEAFLLRRGFKRITDIPWHGDVVFERVS